mmetsp:Transcript_68675/g.183318  ORF Transcript_68675/g.183318 Transcript_68675/m.183318 type:complete len:114 (-) Transcript_68675:361-702(-)
MCVLFLLPSRGSRTSSSADSATSIPMTRILSCLWLRCAVVSTESRNSRGNANKYSLIDVTIDRPARHENHKIYDMAVKILETYFGVDEEEEAPMMDQPGGFQFNPNGAAPQVG